jgi:hypothetical protein
LEDSRKRLIPIGAIAPFKKAGDSPQLLAWLRIEHQELLWITVNYKY